MDGQRKRDEKERDNWMKRKRNEKEMDEQNREINRWMRE